MGFGTWLSERRLLSAASSRTAPPAAAVLLRTTVPFESMCSLPKRQSTPYGHRPHWEKNGQTEDGRQRSGGLVAT